MIKQTKYNVGIYVRLSQEDERAGESLSIENQKLILTEYVAKQGWELTNIYVDDGYSGTDFNRPSVQRLLEDAQTGVINLILVKDLSRFGRNYIEVGRYIDYVFPAFNIRFIALSDNVDTLDKNSTALEMMPIVNLFNEWHAASTSKKLRVVKEANAKAGKYRAIAAAYGYEKSEDESRRPIIDEPAAEIVRRIFAERASGKGTLAIANDLNDDKIPVPTDYRYAKLGKPNAFKTNHLWCNNMVQGILKNPIYIGTLAQLRTTTVSYKNHKVIRKDPSEWIVVENTHEPIIEKEIWDKVREIEASVSRGKYNKRGIITPLSGLLFCADCGKKMRLSWTDQKNSRYEFFQCGTFNSYGRKYCQSHYISQKALHGIILEDIRSMARLVVEDEDGARKNFLAEKEKRSARQMKDEQKRLKKARARLDELSKLIPKIYEDKVIGKIPEDVCTELLEKYQAEKKALTADVEEIEARALAEKQDERDVEEFISRLKKYTDVSELTREMCLELIEYVTIDKRVDGEPRNIHVYYKFIDNAPLPEDKFADSKKTA